MGNKEEFQDLYVETMDFFKESIEYLTHIDDEIKNQSKLLKALDEIPDCDSETRNILNKIYQDLNAINIKMRRIRKEKEAKKQKLDPYFKVFDYPSKEYIQTIIELNDLLKKHQPVIGKQILKCFNYLNDRGVEIVL